MTSVLCDGNTVFEYLWIISNCFYCVNSVVSSSSEGCPGNRIKPSGLVCFLKIMVKSFNNNPNS